MVKGKEESIMKKTFSNIRTLAALLMAGAAFAACSSDENIIEQQPVDNGEQVYTLTIEATKGDDATRALRLDGSKLVASWKTTDELTVLKGETPVGTLTPKDITNDKATFTGTITGSIAVDDALTLAYHPIADPTAFASQSGILTGTTNSAETFDMATATVTVKAIDGTDITINEAKASFTNQTAVLKLTLKDGAKALNATELNVKAKMTVSGSPVEQDVFTFAPTAATYATNGDGVLYFSLPGADVVGKMIATSLGMSAYASAITAKLASADITFTATVGSDTYYLTKPGYQFVGGKYYTATLDMIKQGSLQEAFVKDVETEMQFQVTDGGYYNLTIKSTFNGTDFGTTTMDGDAATYVLGDASFAKNGKNIEITFTKGTSGKMIIYTNTNTYAWDPELSGVGFTFQSIYIGGTAFTPLPTSGSVAATGHALSLATVTDIVGSDGLAYAAADKSKLPYGVEALAVVAYQSGGSTLAMGLKELGSIGYSDASMACNNLNTTTHIDGTTWSLPSQDDWDNMIVGLGGWSDFKATVSLSSGLYWSSTDGGMTESNATLDASMGTWSTMGTDWSTPCNTRAVLAW